MKNIHVLPTKKPSKLYFNHNKGFEKYQFSKEPFINGLTNTTNQRIYITSDEDIKEGDWFICQNGFEKKCVGTTIINNEVYLLDYLENTDRLIWCKKIILTTDQDLIEDGVQAIDDRFLEWFVNNPSCEEVEVGYGFIRLTENDNKGYWISIPNAEFNMSIEEPKQETLEEVAETFLPHSEIEHDTDFIIGFIAGAKWQQERMYSEEESIQKIIDYVDFQFNTKGELNLEIKKWFEQFKKK